MSPVLNFGPSFVINYSILLWHNCLDNLNIKLSGFKTKQMGQVFCFLVFGFLTKTTNFLCASREIDSLSFSC